MSFFRFIRDRLRDLLGSESKHVVIEPKPIQERRQSGDAVDNGEDYRNRRRRRPTQADAPPPPRVHKEPDRSPKLPQVRHRDRRSDGALPEIVIPQALDGKTRFTDLKMSKEIICGIQDLGFQYCTPIQEKTLPSALEGMDITGKAQTGTGKTAAFLCAIYNHILSHPKTVREPGSCRALVLAPTRELAIQIHKDAEAIGKYCGCNNLVAFGGMGHQEQKNALQEHIDILVGTPGRLIDYMRSGHLHVEKTEILVIDEADRMLDMGFIPDVTRIVSRMPPPDRRRTFFFSATLTGDILRLVNKWLVNPLQVEIEAEHIVTELIDQKFIAATRDERLPTLLWMLANQDVSRMLVFSNRKDITARLSATLQANGVQCESITGDIEQRQRIKILERFRAGTIKVLAATDVAARGIHVDDISHVVNYDLPESPEDYVHRVGRTGRAGKRGTAVSFLDEYGAYLIPELEKLLGFEIRSEPPPSEIADIKVIRPKAVRRSSGDSGGYSGGYSGSIGRSGRPPPRRTGRPR